MSRTTTAEYVKSIISGGIPSPQNALSDLRFFYNSVDRLMKALHRSGAEASVERKELAQETVVTIRVAHRRA